MTDGSEMIMIEIGHPGVAKLGIALGSGPRGRGFKSRHSDHDKLTDYTMGVVCQLFILNILNSLCRSDFTAVFLLLKEDHNELNSKK